MHAGQGTGFVFSTGKGHFELAAKALSVRMTQQEFRACFGVWFDIEHFTPAHTRNRARGDVANGIAARFARRNAHGCKPSHQVRRILDMDIMELEVLARGDMEYAVGIFLGHFSEGVKLIRRYAPEWDLDTLHAGRVPKGFGALGQVAQVGKFLFANAVVPMPIVVTLTITASPQASFRKNLLIELALAAQRHLRFENVYLFGKLVIRLVRELLFPRGHFRTSEGQVTPIPNLVLGILPCLIEVVNIRTAKGFLVMLKCWNQGSYI